MTTIYWAGGEDSDFNLAGGSSVDTTAGHFRSAYARCGIKTLSSGSNNFMSPALALNIFSLSTFWLTARSWCANPASTGCDWLRLYDSSNILRMRFVPSAAGASFQVFKVNAAGTSTQIGGSATLSFSNAPAIPDKVDVFINDNVSGTVTVYFNGQQVFTFSGDTTTDSVSTLAGFGLCGINQGNGAYYNVWSEVIVSDSDTRNWSLQTLAPVANGNTHNFDTGTPAAANVNETTLNDTTLDGSTTAGQIDQYTIPAIAAGTVGIIGVGVSARMALGSSGPTKADLNVRSGGTDYFSSDKALSAAWTDYQNWWMTDPNTSASWTALPSNIGIKSVT